MQTDQQAEHPESDNVVPISKKQAKKQRAQDLNFRLAAIADGNDEILGRVGTLELKAQDVDAVCEELEQDALTHRQELAELQASVDGLKLKGGKAGSRLSRLEQRAGRLEHSASDLVSRADALEAAEQRLSAETMVLKQRLDTLEPDHQRVGAKAVASERRLDALAPAHEQLNAEAVSLDRRLGVLEPAHEALKQGSVESDQRASALEGGVADLTRRFTLASRVLAGVASLVIVAAGIAYWQGSKHLTGMDAQMGQLSGMETGITSVFSQRVAAAEASLTSRMGEQDAELEASLTSRMGEQDAELEARLAARMGEQDTQLEARMAAHMGQQDAQLETRLATQIGQQEAQLEAGLAAQMDERESAFNTRFEAIDTRQAGVADMQSELQQKVTALLALANSQSSASDEVLQEYRKLVQDIGVLGERLSAMDSEVTAEIANFEQRLFTGDADRVPAPIDLAGLRDASWFKAQNPRHFAVQLIGVYEERALAQFVSLYGDHLPIADLGFFKRTRNGKDWYVLVLGRFSRFEQAQETLRGLPESLQTNRPFIRSFDSIQKKIS